MVSFQLPFTSQSSTLVRPGFVVADEFVTAWQGLGNVFLQGHPISGRLFEAAADGNVYTVQYFERAVYEHHPDDALNSTVRRQLGKIRYQELYNGNAPGQHTPDGATPASGSPFHIGGGFREFYAAHGKWGEFGDPISDEFMETRVVDGVTKKFTVQYFEYAEFEYHPENALGQRVQLARLGAMSYADRYAQPVLQKQLLVPNKEGTHFAFVDEQRKVVFTITSSAPLNFSWSLGDFRFQPGEGGSPHQWLVQVSDAGASYLVSVAQMGEALTLATADGGAHLAAVP